MTTSLQDGGPEHCSSPEERSVSSSRGVGWKGGRGGGGGGRREGGISCTPMPCDMSCDMHVVGSSMWWSSSLVLRSTKILSTMTS